MTPRCGSLRPFIHADVRCIDDVIAIEGRPKRFDTRTTTTTVFDRGASESFSWRQELRAQLSLSKFKGAFLEEAVATRGAHAYLTDVARSQHPVAALDLVGRFKGVVANGARIDSLMNPGYKVKVTPSPPPPPLPPRAPNGRANALDADGVGAEGVRNAVPAEEWYGRPFEVPITLNQLRALKSAIKLGYGEDRYKLLFGRTKFPSKHAMAINDDQMQAWLVQLGVVLAAGRSAADDTTAWLAATQLVVAALMQTRPDGSGGSGGTGGGRAGGAGEGAARRKAGPSSFSSWGKGKGRRTPKASQSAAAASAGGQATPPQPQRQVPVLYTILIDAPGSVNGHIAAISNLHNARRKNWTATAARTQASST